MSQVDASAAAENDPAHCWSHRLSQPSFTYYRTYISVCVNFNHKLPFQSSGGHFWASVVIIHEERAAALQQCAASSSHTSILDTAAVTPRAESGFQPCADRIISPRSPPDLKGERECVCVLSCGLVGLSFLSSRLLGSASAWLTI